MARRRTNNEMDDDEKLIENEEDFEVASKTSSTSSSSSSSIKVTVSDLEEDVRPKHRPRINEERHLVHIPVSFKRRFNALRSTRGRSLYWWITVAILGVLVIFALSVPLGVWENRPKQNCLDFEDVPEEEYEEFPFLFPGNGEFTLCQRGQTKLRATLGLNHDYIQEVKVDFYSYSGNTWLNLTRLNKNCLRVEWVGTATINDPLKDCYKIGEEYWYAGYETYTQNWPINANTSYHLPLMPFLPNDYLAHDRSNKDAFGPVLHPLWLSSNGSAIVVGKDVQLYVSIDNDTKEICLHARSFELDCIPQASVNSSLNYTVCVFENIADTAKYIVNSSGLIEHPQHIPDLEVFRKPIWSTWARYKTNINDSALQEFYNDIVTKYNFSISQLEVDDGYSVHYGELQFNQPNFSAQNLANLAAQVNLTTWVHPFINPGADVFREAVDQGYLLPGYSRVEGNSVSLVKWWHDYGAVINFLNANASDWHEERLAKFTRDHHLTSLKFDAGEFTYLPKCEYIDGLNHPSDFTKAYARFVGSKAYASRAEVRVGYFTQDLPVFVRMLDRDSTWGLDNGLQSVLTAALTFGIAGYPFVLPDMIGGNGVDGTDLDNTQLPDLSLYVRWVQLNAFLPVMQFSIAPWQFGNESVTDNARKMVELHMNLSSVFIELARNATQTGFPIIRPLWWIVQDADPMVWKIYDQFLIGDDIMVAPILEPNITSRSVYFPHNTCWKVADELPSAVRDVCGVPPSCMCSDGKTETFTLSLWDTLYFNRVYPYSG